jgi:hypothetical protein
MGEDRADVVGREMAVGRGAAAGREAWDSFVLAADRE